MLTRQEMKKLLSSPREEVTRMVRATASIQEYVAWFKGMAPDDVGAALTDEHIESILHQVADRGTNLALVEAAIDLGVKLVAARERGRTRNGDPAHKDFAKHHKPVPNFGNTEPHEA